MLPIFLMISFIIEFGYYIAITIITLLASTVIWLFLTDIPSHKKAPYKKTFTNSSTQTNRISIRNLCN